MTVRECYEAFGGNYDEALTRLMKEDRVQKYLLKFLDAPDYANLLSALDAGQYEEAFRAVHNIKGVALNLSLTPLHRTSDVLCEALRHGAPTVDISGMLLDVKEAYRSVTDAIKQLA